MLNWYLQSGKESDVVLSTRIRLARNIKDIPFPTKYGKKDAEQIIQKMEEVLPSIGYGLKLIRLRDMDNITKLSLIEKHIISPDFAVDEDDVRAILMNEEENICIMINEEDHLRIQVLSSGLELENSLNFAIEIDEKIEKLVNYAFQEKYGFLTSCPTNVGTGLRASVMVHLPALTMTGNLSKVLRIINNLGMSIKGVYGEGTQNQGDLYQISNNQTIGLSEKEIMLNVRNISEKIIEQERTARKYLGQKELELEDRVYRAYGLLTNARKLSSDECKKLISEVKLGIDLGIIKELDDGKIRQIELYTKAGNLQKYVGKVMDGYEREIKRAEVIKQILR